MTPDTAASYAFGRQRDVVRCTLFKGNAMLKGNAMTADALLVLTTCGANDADRIAAALVERGVAACVNAIAGVKSTYRWEGRVVTDSEHLLLIKTTSRQYPLLEAAIRELSNYDVPEVIALSIEAGSAAYLDWLAAAVAGKS